ncbi:MAG TPA: protein kinase [Polyangiaceae bacterium]|nr:protein kinase [Polyangiaceae bacterium]
MSLKELQLPSIASLRAIAALKSPYLALVRPARIGLGFESTGANQKTLAEVEGALGGPGRLSLPYSLCWLLDAMTGLSVLHRTLSFVHGEVQPEHIVLGEDGVGRLIPVVRAHWVRGEERNPERLYYLAPEKLLGDRVDIRSDVFSIGVMLWEALAGQRLLEANNVDDIIARLMGGGMPRAVAPESENWTEPLAGIAERAIAVDPGRRFATVAEMKDAIQSACSRYLASPPGMAALFQNPEQRARTHVRDSIPPESQRVTVPPEAAPAAIPTSPPPADGAHEAARQAAAMRHSLPDYTSVDLEEETTTKPLAVPSPLRSSARAPTPVPVVSPQKHIQTLLGVPPPFIDRDSSPDSITQPFAKIPPSTPVIITPLPVPMSASRPPPRSITPAGPPPRLTASAPPPASAPAPPSAPVESRRAVSLSPLVAAPTPAPVATVEPSFELTRPRKRRGALWLVLGAAAAIGVFAARPWLARQVALATGSLPDKAADNADANTRANDGAAPPAAAGGIPLTSATTSSTQRVVGIASTPAAPSTPAVRGRGGPREEHVVIQDTIAPEIKELAAGRPPVVEPKPEPTPTPTPVAPPTPPAPAASPAPTPKPKQVPVSDADRYGI